jgi:hypothetical protein
VHVLATVDERTYKGGDMEPNHPIAWYHQDLGDRALYTPMGFTIASYHEPLFLQPLQGAMRMSSVAALLAREQPQAREGSRALR